MVKDRIILGLIAGLAGNAVKTIIDEVSIKKKFLKNRFATLLQGYGF